MNACQYRDLLRQLSRGGGGVNQDFTNFRGGGGLSQ